MLTAALAILLIITFIYLFAVRENFTSKREKAHKIHEWFSNNNTHKYADYRGALDRQSNIVEFEDVKKLFDKKNFTVDTVESVI